MGVAAAAPIVNQDELPQGWERRRLGDIVARLEAGVSVRSAGEGARAARRLAVLKTSAISGGKFDPAESKPIAADDVARAKGNPLAGSILISRMNTPDLVGECGYVERDYPELFLPDRIWMAHLRPEADVNALWLSQLLSSDSLKAELRAAATGTSGSMKNLSKQAFLSIDVAVPPRPQQDAIAAALRSMDDHVVALDHLVEKEKGIALGAMQQLLTGAQRLPGFTDPWTVSQLRSIGETYGGLTGKNKAHFGKGAGRFIPFMNVMAAATLDPDWLESVEILPGERQNPVKQGDLLFNSSSETPGELAMCSVLLCDIGEVYLNSFCFGFRLQAPEHLPLFLAYLFRGAPGRSLMQMLAQGATRYNLSKRSFLGLSVALPEFAEQCAIAEVLVSLDASVAARGKLRHKALMVRQAAAHALLTGHTCLL